MSLKAKGVSTTTFIYHLKRKDIIDVHKNKVYAAGAVNNKPKPTQKKYISSQAAALKKAPNSKASDTEDNELVKYRIRRVDIRPLLVSNQSKQTSLWKLCYKTLFKDKLALSVLGQI